jgi:glucokinase
MDLFLGLEIGGTKLQLGLGPANGQLLARWRDTVDVSRGGNGIREQILSAVPELLFQAKVDRNQVKAMGVGFGGPIDDTTQRVIKSHQIQGWNDFPLADFLSQSLKIPCVLGNDADVAGLAEALFGAGKGFSPIFYMTIGSGIGGGLIIDGDIYRAIGRGAAEIGHLRILDTRKGCEPIYRPLESIASGWGIGAYAQQLLSSGEGKGSPLQLIPIEEVTAHQVGEAAKTGDRFAFMILEECFSAIAEAICSVIALLCPRRLVIGGGVSLMGENIVFEPIRKMVSSRVFVPFSALTEIVPAALGEEVVVHGSLALAKRRLEG